MVMSTGTIRPSLACAWVCALNSLQKAMMFTPCWPSAGPTGGEGFAFPAGSCSLTIPVTFFIASSPMLRPFGLRPAGGGPASLRCVVRTACRLRSGLLHLHEIQLDRRGALLALHHLDDVLHGDEDVAEELLERVLLDLLLEALLGLVLEARVRVDHVPFLVDLGRTHGGHLL